MRTLKLVVEYDGTDFHGFQRQPRSRTVQGVLEEGFCRLLAEPVRLAGAGRTDAGVHAAGQVVSFATSRPLRVERLVQVLNGVLPRDVKVQHCEEADASFHARKSALSRTYRYTITERERPSPLAGRFALVAAPGLDVPGMAEAASRLVGRRDFRAFQARGSAAQSAVRRLLRLECVRAGSLVSITAEADAFVHQMVRRLVGALLLVGRGSWESEAVLRALVSPGSLRLPPPAPPCGLCLMQVSYGAVAEPRLQG